MTRNIFSSWKGSIIEYTKWFTRRWEKEKSVPSEHTDFGKDKVMQKRIFVATRSVYDRLSEMIDKIEDEDKGKNISVHDMEDCLKKCADLLHPINDSLYQGHE